MTNIVNVVYICPVNNNELMETGHILQHTENIPFNGLNEYPGAPLPGNRSLIKAGAGYALTAMQKVLKLNILGADINTEYLELTVRVYAGALLLSAREYANRLSQKIVIDKKNLAGLLTRPPGYHSIKNLA